MTPHFTWDISLGQVIISIPIFWVMFMLVKLYSMMLRFRIEHEILMNWWASKQDPPVRIQDLPTRLSRWW